VLFLLIFGLFSFAPPENFLRTLLPTGQRRTVSESTAMFDSETVCLWLVDHSFDRAIKICAVYSLVLLIIY